MGVDYRHSHIDIAEVTEAILDHVLVLLPVKDGPQEATAAGSAHFPPPHGGVGRVHDGGDQAGQDVSRKQPTSQLHRSQEQTHAQTHKIHIRTPNQESDERETSF